MTKLAGRAACITGGGRGIGRAIALEFAREGADIGILARSQSEIEAVAKEVADLGRRAIAVCCDVSSYEQVETALAELDRGLGRIDILVNNAGGGAERRVVGQDAPHGWRKVVEVNLLGTYYVARAALPMLRRRGGTIINVGSGMGHEAGTGNSSYNVAKAGTWMLTKCLAMELWQDKITVNELIPGPVETALTASFMQAGKPHPKMPSEWVKDPSDVLPLAIFLAVQGQHGPTGQTFSLARRPVV